MSLKDIEGIEIIESNISNEFMSGGFNRITGVVTAYERDNLITIEGVPGFLLEGDISRNWGTAKISNNIFNKVTRFTIRFKSFFALDVLFILNQLLAAPHKVYAGKNTAKKIIDALMENTWLRKINEQHPPRLNFSRLNIFYKTPLPHQKEFFDVYNKKLNQYNLNGYLLAAAAGSGKTITGCMLAEMLEVNYCIIVCPMNAVNRVWETTLKEEFKIKPSYWIAKDNDVGTYKKEKFIITHYESLEKVLEIAKLITGKFLIILDESHNLNEISSMRTQRFLELCKITKAKDIIWASGTPFKALGSESIPLLSCIDPLFDEDSKIVFKKIFGKDAKKALELLANRIGTVSFTVEKKELKISDPIIENINIKTPNGELYTLDKIKVDMTNFILERTKYYAERKEGDHAFFDQCIEYYKSNLKTKDQFNDLDKYLVFLEQVKKADRFSLHLVKDQSVFCNSFENKNIMPNLPDDWKKRFKDVKSIVKYVELKIQGETLGRILGKKRMECVKELSTGIEYAKYIESTVKKTIIFTSYVEVLEEVQKIVTSLGYNPVSVYGKTNSELNALVTRFDKEKEINPLIATFPSLSTAVPLVMADVMLMTNSPFRDYMLQQAISRIHRIGATTQVYVYIAYLDTGDKPNLSTRTIDILKWSQTQIEAITGVKSPFEVEELKVSVESYKENLNLDIGISFKDIGLEEYFDYEEIMNEEIKKLKFKCW